MLQTLSGYKNYNHLTLNDPAFNKEAHNIRKNNEGVVPSISIKEIVRATQKPLLLLFLLHFSISVLLRLDFMTLSHS